MSTRIWFLSTSLAVALAGSSAGCSGRTAAWQDSPPDQAAPPATATAASPTPELAAAPVDPADTLWAQRTDSANIRQAIALWKQAVEADPDNLDALVKLTRAHYFLADGYLRDQQDQYLATMDQGVAWGERALMVASPEFAATMRDDKGKFIEAIGKIERNAVPAAYWYAASLGKWAKRKSFAVLLGQKDNVKATMDRCLALDPDYFHAGPDRYFGAFYAVAPGFAGGDLDKSQAHYDKSLAKAPYYLGTKVLMAENLMVKRDDEATFVRLLEEVIAADLGQVPDLAPEMAVEQAKAKELLASRDEYF